MTYIKRTPKEQMQQMVAGKHSCIVVITCGDPSEDGQMPVEMMYEGDSGLAGFLLESAQRVLEEQEEPG